MAEDSELLVVAAVELLAAAKVVVVTAPETMVGALAVARGVEE